MADSTPGVVALKGLKVERQNLAQQAAARLREAIIAGDFAPGDRLTEVSVAEALSVSCGTLRAGLAQLEVDGFVVRERYSAWRVASLEASDIWESYTLRAALESMAARLVAERIDPSIRDDLQRRLQSLSKAKTASARAERDLALHLAIVEHAGHRQLSEIYQRTLNRFRWIYALSEASEPARVDLVDWHDPLVSAICAGEPDEAARLADEMIMASLSDDLRAAGNARDAERSA